MAQTEDLGISFIHSQIAKMGFFFREQPKHDFGVDAHIETADSEGRGTGRNIAFQIKSGLSYVKENAEGDIAYYTDEQHIKYWAEHSLPVILTVYDPEQEIAWWCVVKAFISRHPRMLFKGPYKLILPSNQQFNITTKDSLVELATIPQSPLTLEKQHYSFISTNDISTAQTKRYRAEIMVGNVSSDITRIAIYQATERLKNTVEHNSNRLAAHWGNQKPHFVALFVYRDLDDKAHTNWIARTAWRDPSNQGAQLVGFGKTNDSTDDVEIEFADSQKHEVWRKFVSGRVVTKHQFLNKVKRWVSVADQLIAQALVLIEQRENQQITEENYIQSMSRLAHEYTKQVEQTYDDGTSGPSEVQDAEIRYVGTIGSGSNVFIAFTPRGLQTWSDQKRRDYMVNSYLKRYKEDREMLMFELKKLGG